MRKWQDWTGMVSSTSTLIKINKRTSTDLINDIISHAFPNKLMNDNLDFLLESRVNHQE